MVKKRSYSSSVRQQQAEQTRDRILHAAAELFGRDGYARTTIAGIARQADVAADTIYKGFGSKARLLTALIDQQLAPPGVDSVLDRTEAGTVRDEPDQRRQIQRFAADIAGISERVRPVFEIMRTASAVEPEMSTVLAEMEGYRLRNMQQVADWIAANGSLRVDAERAGETIWALASPDVARMLCDGRGWSREQYAEWLQDALTRALLPGE